MMRSGLAVAALVLVACSGDTGGRHTPTTSLEGAALWQAVEDTTDQFPAVVKINIDGTTFCTGVVIADGYVLTARHCVCSAKDLQECYSEDRVMVGVDMWGAESLHVVQDIEPYPTPTSVLNVSTGKFVYTSGDLAVLKLGVSLNLVPLRISAYPVDYNQNHIVVGYGSTQIEEKDGEYQCNAGPTGIRRYGVIDVEDGQDFEYIVADYDSALIGQPDTVALPPLPMHGDSGGPLITSSDGRRSVVGVVARGYCAELWVKFTSVRKYSDWIYCKIGGEDEVCDDGADNDCDGCVDDEDEDCGGSGAACNFPIAEDGPCAGREDGNYCAYRLGATGYSDWELISCVNQLKVGSVECPVSCVHPQQAGSDVCCGDAVCQQGESCHPEVCQQDCCLEAPLLISPQDGAVFHADVPIAFAWESGAGTRTRLSICLTQEGGSCPVVSDALNPGVSAWTYSPGESGVDGISPGVYYWTAVFAAEHGALDWGYDATPRQLVITACQPQCMGRECGEDGCGGLCGECSVGYVCSLAGVCINGCTPNCQGRSCGSDGCDGTCGVCGSGTCDLGSYTCVTPSGSENECTAGTCCNTDTHQNVGHGVPCGDLQTEYSCSASCGGSVAKVAVRNFCTGQSSACSDSLRQVVDQVTLHSCGCDQRCEPQAAACSTTISCGPPPPYPDGTLVRSPTDPAVYLIKDGQRHWLKSAANDGPGYSYDVNTYFTIAWDVEVLPGLLSRWPVGTPYSYGSAYQNMLARIVECEPPLSSGCVIGKYYLMYRGWGFGSTLRRRLIPDGALDLYKYSYHAEVVEAPADGALETGYAPLHPGTPFRWQNGYYIAAWGGGLWHLNMTGSQLDVANFVPGDFISVPSNVPVMQISGIVGTLTASDFASMCTTSTPPNWQYDASSSLSLAGGTSCYTGHPATRNQGKCMDGTSSYNSDGDFTCVGEIVPTPEDCTNGVDDDCDGSVDGIDVDDCPPPAPVDADGDGVSVLTDCNDGNAAVFPGAAERCNYMDDNCDGATDEGFSLGSPCDSADLDSCKNGTYTCSQSGDRVVCIGETELSIVEVCDGIDNDCDGSTDEGVLNACGGCGPQPELCYDGIDNDCDGSTDENCGDICPTDGLPCDDHSPCTDGELCLGGVCTGISNGVCDDGDGDGVSPFDGDCDDSEREVYPGAKELCDSVDNDCDGNTDEDTGGSLPGVIADAGCATSGACSGAAVASCTDGVYSCMYTSSAYEAVESRCDNIDNDCDGLTDEGLGATSTSCGVGVCARTGLRTCVDGGEVDSCEPGAPESAVDGCDGKDSDCDGATDEDFAHTQTTCGLGACAATGTTLCVAGSVQDTCATGEASLDQDCDGVDDDCDGHTDESYVGSPTECGTGACSSTGVTICSNGIEQDTCEPGLPGTYDWTCDQVDDDCDGATDEDCGVCVMSGVPCNDSITCTVDDTCVGSTCHGTPQDELCPPSTIPCRRATCDAGAGCVPVDDDSLSCSDGSDCTTNDRCHAGECVGDTLSACVDGDDDGATPAEGDCDDTRASVHPGALELCDDLDNDCDGVTDEFSTTSPSTVGAGCKSVGACTTNVLATCTAGVWLCVYHSPQYEANESTCDNVDNDCDGATDEGVPSYVDWNGALRAKGQSCGTGVCAGGTVVCASSSDALTCSTAGRAKIDVCNGADDDCDGVTDNAGSASCDDSDPCTVDSCSGISGCRHDAMHCLDGDACTTDWCSSSSGCGHTPIVCDDHDPCTQDSCDSGTGCVYASTGCIPGAAVQCQTPSWGVCTRICTNSCAWHECPTGVVVSIDQAASSILVEACALELHDGTPVSEEAANGTLCGVFWGAPSTFNNVEFPVTDSDGDGLVEVPIPPVASGLTPYSGCTGPGELPARFTLKRCGAPSSPIDGWLRVDPGDPRVGDFVFVGRDDLCLCTGSLAISRASSGMLWASGTAASDPTCGATPDPGSLLSNGDFSDTSLDLNSWTPGGKWNTWANDGHGFDLSDVDCVYDSSIGWPGPPSARCTVSPGATFDWDMIFAFNGITVASGHSYTLSYCLRGTKQGQIVHVQVQKSEAGDTYSPQYGHTLSTDSWLCMDKTFVANGGSTDSKVAFLIGFTSGGHIYIDSVRFSHQ